MTEEKCGKCGGHATWFVIAPARKVERLICDGCRDILDEREYISEEDMRIRLLALEKTVRDLKEKVES